MHLHAEALEAVEAWDRHSRARALLTGRGAPAPGRSRAARGRLMRRPEAEVVPTAPLQLQRTARKLMTSPSLMDSSAGRAGRRAGMLPRQLLHRLKHFTALSASSNLAAPTKHTCISASRWCSRSAQKD